MSFAHAIEPAAFSEKLQALQTQRKADAKQAAADAAALLQDETLMPAQLYQVVSALATIQSSDLKDVPAALKTLEGGMEKTKDTPLEVYLLVAKARILLSAERAPEAEAILKEKWPALVSAPFRFGVLPVYLQALDAQKKSEAASELARQTIEGALDEVSRQPVAMDAVIAHYLGLNQTETALGVAKLYFMLCAYDEKALQNATQLLSRVWLARDASPVKVAESVQALQDASKPNPLRDVKLPDFEKASLARQWEAASGVRVPPSVRVSLLLAGGKHQEAMAIARSLMASHPQSNEGVLQVCRVFKAHDLHLGRATAFLEYYKSGKGENPMPGFLAENDG